MKILCDVLKIKFRKMKLGEKFLGIFESPVLFAGREALAAGGWSATSRPAQWTPRQKPAQAHTRAVAAPCWISWVRVILRRSKMILRLHGKEYLNCPQRDSHAIHYI
jgi:hypothetical protein